MGGHGRAAGQKASAEDIQPEDARENRPPPAWQEDDGMKGSLFVAPKVVGQSRDVGRQDDGLFKILGPFGQIDAFDGHVLFGV